MTLEDIEKLANQLLAAQASDFDDLARFILLAIPVLRAIPGVLDEETNAASSYARDFHFRVLREAMEAMRSSLGGK